MPLYAGDEWISNPFLLRPSAFSHQTFQGRFGLKLRIFKLFIYCTNKKGPTFVFPNSHLIINWLHNPGCNNCPLWFSSIENDPLSTLAKAQGLPAVFVSSRCFTDVAFGELLLCQIRKTHNAMGVIIIRPGSQLARLFQMIETSGRLLQPCFLWVCHVSDSTWHSWLICLSAPLHFLIFLPYLSFKRAPLLIFMQLASRLCSI